MIEPRDAASRPEGSEQDSTSEEGFLQRWSRRKHQAKRAEQDPDGPAAEPVPDESQLEQPAAARSAALEAEAEAEAVEAEPPGDEDMPPLESIDRGGGVGDFFSPKVSAGLRKAALRRLFSQPEFNTPELLEEYAQDYSKPALLGNIVTADMRFRAEQARLLAERKLKAALEAETSPKAGAAVARHDEGEPGEALARSALESASDTDRDLAESPSRLADNASDLEASSDPASEESKPQPKPIA